MSKIRYYTVYGIVPHAVPYKIFDSYLKSQTKKLQNFEKSVLEILKDLQNPKLLFFGCSFSLIHKMVLKIKFSGTNLTFLAKEDTFVIRDKCFSCFRN